MAISKEILEDIRDEVKYWNNVDFRYTAWGHMSNHLNFLIYHYSLIFPKSMWPKKICVGQFMTRNEEKISKSKGNGTPLYRVKNIFGADLYRLYNGIASNFDVEMDFKDDDVFLLEKKFEKFQNHILNSINEKKEIGEDELRNVDKWLICKFYLNAKNFFSNMEDFKIREAYVEIFYNTLNDLNYHTKLTNEKNTNLVLKHFLVDFLILMTPVIPHICEEFYEKIKTNKDDFISLKKFETDFEKKIDNNLIEKQEIIQNLISKILKEKELQNLKQIKNIKIFQAKEEKFNLFFEIKEQLKENKSDIKKIFENLNKNFSNEKKFIQKFVPKCLKSGISFFMNKSEERKFIEENLLEFLKKEFNCKIEILENEKSNPSDLKIFIE